jgi:hypothetical protein
MRFNPIPILVLALVLLVFGLVPAHASPPFDDGAEAAFVFDAPNDDGTSTPTVLVNPPPIQVSAVAA